jgi:KDO2-lipid IV(A) lauroyltransferase
MMKHNRSMSRFLAPRWWPYWLGLGLLRLIAFLPFSVQLAAGGGLGALLYRAMPKRRLIAARNLAVCFRARDAEEIATLTRAHFGALGIAVCEMSLSWWASDRRIDRLFTIEGLEHLQAARDLGRGVILVSAHFTTLEIAGRLLTRHIESDAMYRPHRNPFINEMLRRGRERSASQTIPKDDARAMLRSLRDKRIVWYAPDQSYRRKHGALVSFFGVPAWTNTGTSRMARLSGAPVVSYSCIRLPGTCGYRLTIKPPLENFPTDDPVADSERLNRWFETAVLAAPEQYLWIHRKFKQVPSPEYADIYTGL